MPKNYILSQTKNKTYIHVNQHNIRSNKTKGTKDPVITIKQGSKNTYCNEVKILGESRLIYSGEEERPLLSCGARVVIETEAPIEIVK
jgi:hypothetical protein